MNVQLTGHGLSVETLASSKLDVGTEPVNGRELLKKLALAFVLTLVIVKANSC